MSFMQTLAWFFYGAVVQEALIYYGQRDPHPPWVTITAALLAWWSLRLAIWAVAKRRRA